MSEVPPGIELKDNIVYGKGGETDLLLQMARPAGTSTKARPAVVFIHGGGWAGSDRYNGTPIILLLAQNGFVAVSIEYRLSPVAGYPAQIHDCKCAVRFLRAHAAEYGIDGERIGVVGGSAGGHLSALVGLTPDDKSLEGSGGWQEYSSKVSAVANLYGISDLAALAEGRNLPGSVERLMRGSPAEMAQEYRMASPLFRVHAGCPPFYITHGDQDEVVPISQAEVLVRALRSVENDVTYRVMPGVKHGAIGILPDYVKKDVVDFFIRTLGPVEVHNDLQA